MLTTCNAKCGLCVRTKPFLNPLFLWQSNARAPNLSFCVSLISFLDLIQVGKLADFCRHVQVGYELAVINHNQPCYFLMPEVNFELPTCVTVKRRNKPLFFFSSHMTTPACFFAKNIKLFPRTEEPSILQSLRRKRNFEKP